MSGGSDGDSKHDGSACYGRGADSIAGAKCACNTPGPARLFFAIRAEQPEAKVGKPIIVDISLTNITSDKTPGIPIDRGGHIGLTYDVCVDDPQGAEAPSTAYLRALRNKRKPDDPDIEIVYSMKVWIVQPCKSLTTHVDVTRLYKIETPGTYTVWVERTDKSSGIRVKSNVVSITVNP